MAGQAFVPLETEKGVTEASCCGGRRRVVVVSVVAAVVVAVAAGGAVTAGVLLSQSDGGSGVEWTYRSDSSEGTAGSYCLVPHVLQGLECKLEYGWPEQHTRACTGISDLAACLSCCEKCKPDSTNEGTFSGYACLLEGEYYPASYAYMAPGPAGSDCPEVGAFCHNSTESSSGAEALLECRGFPEMDTCRACCNGCRTQEGGELFEGRDCVSGGEYRPPPFNLAYSQQCMSHAGAHCDLPGEIQVVTYRGRGGCRGFPDEGACLSCCMACRPMGTAANATFEGQDCVYEGESTPQQPPVAVGRPFVDESTGEALMAPLVADANSVWLHWSLSAGNTVEDLALDRSAEAEAMAAASVWEEAAQAEHASVASFARHLLHLMALGGAPPGLLEGVATAAADEVRHAAASLRVAHLLRGGAAGANKAPGRLPMPPSGLGGELLSLAGMAASVVKEGCLEETVSASLAVAADLAAARDSGSPGPALEAARAAVRDIATEEASHALLAWRTMAWALAGPSTNSSSFTEEEAQGRGEAVREAVDRELALAKRTRNAAEAMSHDQGSQVLEVTPSYGQVVKEADRVAVREAVVGGLVVPWLEALLMSGGAAAELPAPVRAATGTNAAAAPTMMRAAIEAAIAGRGIGGPSPPWWAGRTALAGRH